MYFPDVVCCAAAYNCAPTLIQQNVDGSDFFNRSWEEFRIGFGSPSGNYWLGLDRLSQLTMSGRYKVTFDLQSDDTGTWYCAEYSTFRVLSEADNYRLAVAGYSGNAGDAFTRHSGSSFSTYDRDNDQLPSDSCAATTGGGFWFWACDSVQINLPRVGGRETFSWNHLPGGDALRLSQMWLLCK